MGMWKQPGTGTIAGERAGGLQAQMGALCQGRNEGTRSPVIPSRYDRMEPFGMSTGSIRTAASRPGTEPDTTRARADTEGWEAWSRDLTLGCAQAAVAHRVVDEREQLAGHGGHRYVVPTPDRQGRHLLVEHAAARQVMDRLDRCPPHQLRSLLGDPATVHGGVGLPVLGRQPRPRADRLCRAELRIPANPDARSDRKRTPIPAESDARSG
jgi:hypothetical protein